MKLKATWLAFLFLLLSVSPSHAIFVNTQASHAILLDLNTGTILFSKQEDEHMPTSSMSKTMTLYVVFEALKYGLLKIDEKLPVSEKAWKMGGSRMFIRVGSHVKVEDLIRGVAIQSGNDAAVALAEGVAGTEKAFVERMNVRAKELGMKNTNFVNATGWPHKNHYSTARDLSILTERLIKDFPEYYPYFAEKEFTHNKITQPNRDPLLGRLDGADGVKTGHTDIAGYGLIGSAIRNGRRLILVINGLDSEKARAREGTRLLEWGFRNFESKKIVKAGESIDVAKVYLGEEKEVSLVANKDITLIVPVANRSAVKMSLHYREPLTAPIEKGQPVAKLRIEVPEQPLREVDLFTGENIERKGIFGRVADRLSILLKKL